jgi:hypothetical protein
MRVIRPSVAALVAAGASVVLATGVASAATTVEKVYPSDIGSTWFTADTRPPGSVDIEDTYGGAGGSEAAVVMRTPDGTAKAQFLTDQWAGTELADITAMSYSTYRAPASDNGVSLPAINLRVDLNGDDVADRYMVYEPYVDYGNAAAAVEGSWQSWDAYRSGTARWWISGDPTCGQSTPCTWNQILTLYPDAEIREGAGFPGSLGFNQGSGNPGLIGAADMLQVAAGARDVTYDFEEDVTLSGKDECKKGGWADSTNPEFRNQGDCVSHFASKK